MIATSGRFLLHQVARCAPERAHRLAIRALPLIPAASLPAYPRLRCRLAGLDLPHPLGLAAGFDKNAEAHAALLRQGFAFVEVGTVTPRPQAGNPRPRLFRLPEDRALVNRLGFNSEGLEAVAARLAGRDPRGGVVGVNIGMNRDAAVPADDYRRGLQRLYALADYVAVNVSSPNTPGLRALQAAESLTPLLEALLAARRELVESGQPRKPLFVKVAPDLDEVGEAAVAEVAAGLGIDGLIVGNTTVSRPAGLRSRHAGETGGLSGRPLFQLSTRLLARLALRLQGAVPLVAAGGVFDAADAYAKVRAGATAVQVYTGFVYRGPGLVRGILDGLDALLAADGVGDIAAVVGSAAKEEATAFRASVDI